MKQGLYGGATFGLPSGFGGGLYVDSYGNLYPQLYMGTPKLGVSGGYSNDLEGLLTGLSVGGTLGPIKVGPNFGTSGGASGFGFGTPGGGATYGLGPIPLRNFLDFRPRTDEFGQPFPGSEQPAQPFPGNNSGSQGAAPASGNPVLKFFDSLRPKTDEFGNPFPGPRSSGGVLKYGPGDQSFTSQELAEVFPDESANTDSEPEADASPDYRRLGSRVIRA